MMFYLRDLQRYEINPEINDKEKKEIEEGKRFSQTEWDRWRTIVRYRIDDIIDRTHGEPIVQGSSFENEVFKAVNEFGKTLPPERLRLLKAKKFLSRQVLTDLSKFR